MIVTSSYPCLLLFITILITGAFYPCSVCVAFLDTPYLTKPFTLSSYATSTTNKINYGFLKSKNGSSLCRDSARDAPQCQHNADKTKTFLLKTAEFRKEKSLGMIVLIMFCTMAFIWPIHVSPVMATDDAASATIAAAIQNLMEAAGDKDKSFEALKNVADIITDGKGIGGSLSYSKCRTRVSFVMFTRTTFPPTNQSIIYSHILLS
jgi:hypothetical protein